MKVITIHQPWASLIMAGAKPFEFRTWRPPAAMIGSRIGIHASARKIDTKFVASLFTGLRDSRLDPVLAGAAELCLHPDKALPILSRAWVPADDPLRTGVILGTARIGEPVPASEAVRQFFPLSDAAQRDDSGLWAWPLEDVYAWPVPAPARGTQKFWTWNRTLWPRRILSAAQTDAHA